MRRTILSFCVVSVLAWGAGTVLAQGQGQGKDKEQGVRPADRAANPTKAGETAKVDVNAPAAKKAPTAQDIEKGARERAKGVMDRGQEQSQMRGKAMKDQVAGKTAETKAKGREQQTRAFEMQAQRDAAKHMERQARLARIRELAVQKGDTKMVAQVDQLIAKENQVYDRKLTKMQGQKRAGGMMPPAGGPMPGAPVQGKVDVNKPAEPKPGAQTPPPAPAPAAPAPQKAPGAPQP